MPVAAALPVPRDARSEPMPTDALPTPDVAMHPSTLFACLGVTFAIRVLLEDYSQPGQLPSVFNERRHPLCGALAPPGIVSFVWTDRTGAAPHQSAVHDFVLLVVSRLHLTLKELCLAYAIVEQLIVNHPSCVQAHSLRPIFLTACMIATKVTHELPYTVGSCYECVRDVLTWTSIPLMKTMEAQLLSLLDFDLPSGPIHQQCAPNAAFPRSPMRTWIPCITIPTFSPCRCQRLPPGCILRGGTPGPRAERARDAQQHRAATAAAARRAASPTPPRRRGTAAGRRPRHGGPPHRPSRPCLSCLSCRPAGRRCSFRARRAF